MKTECPCAQENVVVVPFTKFGLEVNGKGALLAMDGLGPCRGNGDDFICITAFPNTTFTNFYDSFLFEARVTGGAWAPSVLGLWPR